jgi:hypothetical protein
MVSFASAVRWKDCSVWMNARNASSTAAESTADGPVGLADPGPGVAAPADGVGRTVAGAADGLHAEPTPTIAITRNAALARRRRDL